MTLTAIGEMFPAEMLAKLEGGISGDAAIVQLELPPTYAGYSGLDSALELAPSGQPVLMLAFSSEVMLASNRKYQLALSYGNVRFERLPLSTDDIGRLLSEMVDRQTVWQDNLLVRRVLGLPELQRDTLKSIRHDLDHAQCAEDGSQRRIEMDGRWMPRAVKLFGNLDREMLIVHVEAAEQIGPEYAPLDGERFDAACCDVEGTLFDTNGNLNEQLLAELRLIAQSRPVVLWTAGDLEAIDRSIRRVGIDLPLVPKEALRGVTIAMAVDDLSEEEFVSAYGITVDEYRRI